MADGSIIHTAIASFNFRNKPREYLVDAKLPWAILTGGDASGRFRLRWRQRMSNTAFSKGVPVKDVFARKKSSTSSPPVRHTVIRRSSPAPWQMARSSTPLSPHSTLGLNEAIAVWMIEPSAMARAKSGESRYGELEAMRLGMRKNKWKKWRTSCAQTRL
jgi:hypothetical protein